MLAPPDTFTVKGYFGAGNRKRVRDMILLLRYSGLRISDASALERSCLKGKKLFLYMQKGGPLVWVPIRNQSACSRGPSGSRRSAIPAAEREAIEKGLPRLAIAVWTQLGPKFVWSSFIGLERHRSVSRSSAVPRWW